MTTATKKRILHVIVVFMSVGLLELGLRGYGDFYLRRMVVHKYPHHASTPGKVNILCLGESSTAGLGVAGGDAYPLQLQGMLRARYPDKTITAIIPPHVGQNTSQVANRIDQYIQAYRPRLIIVMAGYNNEWSLAELHIGKFLKPGRWENIRIRSLIALSNLRLFKLLRYGYLRFILEEESPYMDGLAETGYAWGGPELTRFPPPRYVYKFALEHRTAFIELWREDIHQIIAAAKARDIPIMLMTYHINPSYLPVDEFVAMAAREGVPLVRNDLTFHKLREEGTLPDYLMGDRWHPTREGYALIAENALRVILEHRWLD